MFGSINLQMGKGTSFSSLIIYLRCPCLHTTKVKKRGLSLFIWGSPYFIQPKQVININIYLFRYHLLLELILFAIHFFLLLCISFNLLLAVRLKCLTDSLSISGLANILLRSSNSRRTLEFLKQSGNLIIFMINPFNY